MAYNGWTNYATWRIALEIFDGIDTDYWADDIENTTGEMLQAYSFGETLRDYTEEQLECDNQLANSYANAFINDVNFREIAEHIIDEYKENYRCYNCNDRIDEDERYKVHYCSERCHKENELLATHPKG